MAKRAAFLCGINKYRNAQFRILRNAVSDARDLKEVLESRYGFETTLRTSVDGPAIKDDYDRFLREAREAEIILFYFAGHGVRVEADTFFVPNRIRIGDSLANFLDQCVQFQRLISDSIARCKDSKRIFLFDCCRKPFDEFKDRFHDSTEYVPRKIFHREGANDIVVYAARLNESASDGIGPHSPFCSALLDELKEPTRRYLSTQLDVVRRRAGQNLEQPFIGDDAHSLSLLDLSAVFRGKGTGRQPLDQGMNITDISMSADGSIIAVAAGKTTKQGLIRCVHLASSRTLDVLQTSKELDGLAAKPYCADLNENGSKVAIGCWDGTIAVWSRRDRLVKILASDTKKPVNSIGWSGKANYIAAGLADGRVLLYDAAGRTPLARGTHDSDVWSITFHKDGQFFASGSRDGTCRLWATGDLNPLEAGSLIARRHLNIGSPVRSVRFSRDGQRLVVGTQDARVRIYQFFLPSVTFVELPGFRHKRQGAIMDDVSILRDLVKDPAQRQAWNDAKDKTAQGLKTFLDSRMFILSVDISDDGNIVAFGTNIDGFFLYDLQKNSPIGGMKEYLDKWGNVYCRVPSIRLDTRSGGLVAGSGRKVITVDFHD